MPVELRFFATYREAVGQKTLEWALGETTTVGGVLAALEAEFADLEGALLDDGAVPPQVTVLKNGRAIAHLDGATTPIEAGDVLAVFPPVAGG